MVITLGHIATGIMGTDEKLIEKVKDSAENTFEKVWELPLWPEFLKQVKSEIADVKNIGAARQAGTIAGGAFLKEFVGDNIPGYTLILLELLGEVNLIVLIQKGAQLVGYKACLGYDGNLIF